MSRSLFSGEKRNVGLTLSRDGGAAFTIATATYDIRTSAGTSIDSGSATIDGADVYVLVDTTQTDMPLGQYKVWFSCTITGMSKIIKGYVIVEVT